MAKEETSASENKYFNRTPRESLTENHATFATALRNARYVWQQRAAACMLSWQKKITISNHTIHGAGLRINAQLSPFDDVTTSFAPALREGRPCACWRSRRLRCRRLACRLVPALPLQDSARETPPYNLVVQASCEQAVNRVKEGEKGASTTSSDFP